MAQTRASLKKAVRGLAAVLDHAASQTILFFLVGWAAYALLGINEGDDQFTNTDAWGVWKVAAAFGIALALTLGIAGCRTLVRLVGDSQYKLTMRKVVAYVFAAVILVAAVTIFLNGVPSSIPRDGWQISHMQQRTRAVVAAASIPAIPWIALVWISHQAEKHTAEPTVSPDNRPVASIDLDDRWRFIVTTAETFTLFVLVALIPTGALRVAWLAQDESWRNEGKSSAQIKDLENAFPASNVLLYGAFYAVLLVVIILPLVAAWRSNAQAHVDAQYPLDKPFEKTWAEGRALVEKVLHLDVGLIRNPLTALAVLTPLATAALATVLPELAN
jgi:hypothetical protein